MRAPFPCRRGERGSISLLAAAAMVVATVLAMAAADLARVLRARADAQMAADAAALAAAQELALPSESEPAEEAAEMAVRNGASLVSCICTRGTFEAEVEVRVPVGGMLLLHGIDAVTSRAKAVVDLPSPPPTAVQEAPFAGYAGWSSASSSRESRSPLPRRYTL